MKDLSAELAEMGIEEELAPLPTPKAVPPLPDGHWTRCKGWIAEGLEGSLLRIEDIEGMLAQGLAVLWPAQNCAIVTEFVTYPSGERAAQVLSAGGDLNEILSLIPGMEAYGRLNGCSMVAVEGRRGWERALKENGYQFWSVTLKKRL